MDVVMPNLNGFQATRAISKEATTAHIPIVLVTTKDQETDKVWGMRQGAHDYMVKPVDQAALLAKIAALSWLCAAASGLVHPSPTTLGRLYWFTELLGRWSMVDIFVVGILVPGAGLAVLLPGVQPGGHAGVGLGPRNGRGRWRRGPRQRLLDGRGYLGKSPRRHAPEH